jgi:hypothetical protein
LPSSSSSTANWASVTVGELAGPADRRASMPPSRQARRQRSTDRTLTRKSLAITAVFSPAANDCDRPGGSPGPEDRYRSGDDRDRGQCDHRGAHGRHPAACSRRGGSPAGTIQSAGERLSAGA